MKITPENYTSLDPFTRAYMECALWSSNDESNASGGEPFDSNYDPSDIAPEAFDSMIEDCRAFQEAHYADIGICLQGIGRGPDFAGHDFWLTRNHHGAGFWDRYNGDDEELSAAFDRLDKASKAYGECNLYLGDDGQIYLQ